MLIRNSSSPTMRKEANATIWSNAYKKFDSVIFLVIRISLGSCSKTGWCVNKYFRAVNRTYTRRIVLFKRIR